MIRAGHIGRGMTAVDAAHAGRVDEPGRVVYARYAPYMRSTEQFGV
jgi:hypothetical protein